MPPYSSKSIAKQSKLDIMDTLSLFKFQRLATIYAYMCTYILFESLSVLVWLAIYSSSLLPPFFQQGGVFPQLRRWRGNLNRRDCSKPNSWEPHLIQKENWRTLTGEMNSIRLAVLPSKTKEEKPKMRIGWVESLRHLVFIILLASREINRKSTTSSITDTRFLGRRGSRATNLLSNTNLFIE